MADYRLQVWLDRSIPWHVLAPQSIRLSPLFINALPSQTLYLCHCSAADPMQNRATGFNDVISNYILATLGLKFVFVQRELGYPLLTDL